MNLKERRSVNSVSYHRPIAVGSVIALVAGISIGTSGAAVHADESPLPGIRLTVPVTDVTETDTSLAAVAREVVVTFKGEDGEPAVRKLQARTGFEADQLVAQLNAQPGVVAAMNRARKTYPVPADQGAPSASTATADEPSRRLQSSGTLAGEPYGAYQWGMRDVGAEAAWQVSRGAGVVVAVMDSGVDTSHPDLAGQTLPQIDAVNDGLTGYADSHGTHVAGVIAASLDGGGVAGLANSVKVLPIRIADARGYMDTESIVSGIYDAVEAGAKVINMSYGGGYDALEEAYVQYAIDSGVTVVAAGGNEGQEGSPVTYPAAYDRVIGVGAYTASGDRADFSSTGWWIDISAPGEDILSTVPGGSWESLQGTSMAAPFVSATAALALAANPTLNVRQVERSVLDSAQDDPDGDGPDTWFGAGYLRAYEATVKAAQAPGGVRACAVTPAPTTSVKVRAVSKQSKLRVDVNPNKGSGYWKFQVQKQRASGSWKSLKTYRTKGSKEIHTINLKRGTYRVLVKPKYGYGATTSGLVSLRR